MRVTLPKKVKKWCRHARLSEWFNWWKNTAGPLLLKGNANAKEVGKEACGVGTFC